MACQELFSLWMVREDAALLDREAVREGPAAAGADVLGAAGAVSFA
jgi:hypothetical protein